MDHPAQLHATDDVRTFVFHVPRFHVPVDRTLPPFGPLYPEDGPTFHGPRPHDAPGGDWFDPALLPAVGGACYLTHKGFRPALRWRGYIVLWKIRVVDHDDAALPPLPACVRAAPSRPCHWAHWRYYLLADGSDYRPVHIEVMYILPPPPCPAHIEACGPGDEESGFGSVSLHGLEGVRRLKDAEPGFRGLALVREVMGNAGRRALEELAKTPDGDPNPDWRGWVEKAEAYKRGHPRMLWPQIAAHLNIPEGPLKRWRTRYRHEQRFA